MKVVPDRCRTFGCMEYTYTPHGREIFHCNRSCHIMFIESTAFSVREEDCKHKECGCQECEELGEVPNSCPWKLEMLMQDQKP